MGGCNYYNHSCEYDSTSIIMWVVLMALAYSIVFIIEYFRRYECYMWEIDPSINYKFSVKCFYDDKYPYYRIKISRFGKIRYTVDKWTSIDECKKAIVQLYKERIDFLENRMNENKRYLNMSIDAYSKL